MKLVKFDNGTWGVRRWWFLGWWFNGILTPRYSWHLEKDVMFFCQGTEEQARAVYQRLKSKYKYKYKYTIVKD